MNIVDASMPESVKMRRVTDAEAEIDAYTLAIRDKHNNEEGSLILINKKGGNFAPSFLSIRQHHGH